MAIPSGSGTEVLKRAFHISGNSTPRTLLTVPTDHIYTVLLVTMTNHAGADHVIDLYVDIDGQTELPWFVKQQDLGSHATFVWNDKFVMVAGDVLKLASNAVAEIKCYISYIDQDWT